MVIIPKRIERGRDMVRPEQEYSLKHKFMHTVKERQLEPENLLIEEKLSEADEEAEATPIRLSTDEVFDRARQK